MAIDKAVDSAVLDAGLKAIADAIREKGGTSDSLAFPDAMAAAISAIEAGASAFYTETYTPANEGIAQRNITHNLGVVPNFFMVTSNADVSVKGMCYFNGLLLHCVDIDIVTSYIAWRSAKISTTASSFYNSTYWQVSDANGGKKITDNGRGSGSLVTYVNEKEAQIRPYSSDYTFYFQAGATYEFTVGVI